MIYGDNVVYYTPVEAYPVMLLDGGIISGVTGDDNVIVGSTRFFWIYDPDNPTLSGFTGGGKWYCGVPYTPLANISDDTVLRQEFASGERENLNTEFTEWQDVVSNQPSGADYVKDFMELVGFDCFSTNG